MDDPERKGLKIRFKCSTVSELPSWALQEETRVTEKAVGLLHAAVLKHQLVLWLPRSLPHPSSGFCPRYSPGTDPSLPLPAGLRSSSTGNGLQRSVLVWRAAKC